MALTFPFETQLKDGSPVQLVLAGEQDIEPLKHLYRLIVDEGSSYPHDEFPRDDEFMDYWFRGKITIAAYAPDRAHATGMAGAFYLKPNWPGRAGHIANAGFIVDPAWRGRGLGWFLGTTMLDYAKQSGYHGVLFNLVFSENRSARRLWEQLGFTQLGVIPGAVRKNDGSYQDAIIMFRSLVEGCGVTVDELFQGQEKVRRIFDAVHKKIGAMGNVTMRPSKSQVAFRRRKNVAVVWVPGQYIKTSDVPLVLTISFPARDSSSRWKEITRISAHRYTHHLELRRVRDVDNQVVRWLKSAWEAAG